MPTAKSALLHIEETRFPLKHLFVGIRERESALVSLIDWLVNLTLNEPALGFALDMGQERLSREAAWEDLSLAQRSGLLLRRLALLDEIRMHLATRRSIPVRIEETLAEVRSAEDVLGILAGAVLQVGKQTISYRYGKKQPTIAKCRQICTTVPIVKVIWKGRNHAMHWEEKKPNALLRELEVLSGIPLPVGKSNAYTLLHLLDWYSEDDVMEDLRLLVDPPGP